MRLPKYLLSLACIWLLCTDLCQGQEIAQWQKQLNNPSDRKRLDALFELSAAYNQISLDTAVLYGRKAVELSRKMGVDSLLIKSHLRLAVSFFYRNELDSLITHAKIIENYNADYNTNRALAFAYKILSIAYRKKNDLPASIGYSEKGLEIYKQEKDTASLASVLISLSNTYKILGDNKKTFSYLFESKKLYDATNDTEGKGIVLGAISNAYLDLKEKEKALPFLYEAYQILRPDSFPYQHAETANVLGGIYRDDMKYDSALYYYKECLDYYTKLGDDEGIGMIHDNLGNLYRDMGRWEKSYVHLHKGLTISKRLKIPFSTVHAMKDLGLYHNMYGQRDSAAYYFHTALDAIDERKLAMPYIKNDLYRLLYEHYKKKGGYSKALNYHELFLNQGNKIKGLETEKEIAALETKYETEKKDREIERLELKSIVQQSKTRTFRTGLLALAIISILLIAGILYRRRNERNLFALKQKVHEQEKKELDRELTYKTKQLTSHALHMVQKNKVLQELKQRIKDVVKSSDAKNKKELQSIMRRIDFNIQSDEDWNTFRLYFEQTNQDFFRNLQTITNDLTSTELKLCSLIKLNLNIKETASVLNIEPTSVKTARHRLRKKLGLQPGQDLTAFIRQVA